MSKEPTIEEAKKEDEIKKEEEIFAELNQNQELFPFSFGFMFEDKFLQGTFYVENSNTLNCCGHYGELLFNNLIELSGKGNLSDEKMKIIMDKTHLIFNKQRNKQ